MSEGENLPFKSSRAIEAELRRYKYQTFDKLIDLALDGVVSMEEAIQGFRDSIEEPTPEISA